MADKSETREAKVRELVKDIHQKHGAIANGFSQETWFGLGMVAGREDGIEESRESVALLKRDFELLLAAKARAKRIAHKNEILPADRGGSAYMAGYDAAAVVIAADFESPWGDLFEGKL